MFGLGFRMQTTQRSLVRPTTAGESGFAVLFTDFHVNFLMVAIFAMAMILDSGVVLVSPMCLRDFSVVALFKRGAVLVLMWRATWVFLGLKLGVEAANIISCGGSGTCNSHDIWF